MNHDELFTTKKLVFRQKIRNFATRVGYISCLETNGKISPHEAYQKIEFLYKELESFEEIFR